MKYGNDFLAGRLYQSALLKSLRQGEVGGIFLTTFGDAKKTVEKILKTKKLSEIVIHLAPFDGSHKYPVNSLKKQIMKDTAWCEKMQLKYPDTDIMISFFCEHNHKADTMKPLFKEGKEIAPHCFFVNSIWKGEEVPNTITEIHIPNSKQLPPVPKNEFTLAFDGIGGDGSGDFPDCNIQKIIEKYSVSGRLRHIRAWNFRHNGKYGHNDPAKVNEREHFPNEQYLRGSVATLMPREGNTWPDNKLGKSFADDHGNPLNNTKDCRFMCILPDIDSSNVKVFDSKNNIIDTMYRVKPDSPKPKGKRYYSKYFAIELAELAYKKTKSYLIRVGNNSLIDARLRSGVFK